MTSFKRILTATILSAAAAFATAGSADAYMITQSTFSSPAQGFNAGPASAFALPSDAVTANFSYNGPLTFANRAGQNANSGGDLNSAFWNAAFISNYSGAGSLAVGGPGQVVFGATAATNNTPARTGLENFLLSSGSIKNYGYGSLITINLDVLTAGTVLTIGHDDGVSLYLGNTKVNGLTSGPTNEITESVTLTTTGQYTLYYSRQNGTPSVLNVSVPEPVSIALVGTGLVGLGLARRRKAAVAA